jgi:peptidoglycan/LPS O-acetylase OafA/YrhL
MRSFSHPLSQWIDGIIENRSTSAGECVENFDGLRAVAALMVFTLHLSTVPHLTLGPAGVFLFFALSGFLLYSGFLKIREHPDTRTMVAYLVRRIFRVLPLYIVCVVSIAYLFNDWARDFAFRWTQLHVLFVKADFHLWTMKTEMVFYLFLPALILLLYPLRTHRWRCVTLFVVGVVAWYVFEVQKVMQMSGGSPFFAPFLFGMAAVHLRHRVTPGVARGLVLFSLAAILVFSSDYSWGQPVRQFFGLEHMSRLWSHGHLLYLPCVALVLGVSRERSWLWGNRFLRLIGVCGFGFYLWHWLIIVQVMRWGLPTPLYELTCFILTLGLSILTYLLVERPGIVMGRLTARWIKNDVTTFKVVRPAWACLMLLAVFFAYRQAFVTDVRIDVAVDMWSSQATVAKIYIDDGDGFSEMLTGSAPVAEQTWQTLNLKLEDVRIHRLRFDPGETDGEYRIKKISVRYPFDDGLYELDLANFRSLIGVRRLENDKQFLTVVAKPDHQDPVLVYNGETHQPFLHTRTLRILIAVLGTMMLLVVSKALDAKMTARAGANRPAPKPYLSQT